MMMNRTFQPRRRQLLKLLIAFAFALAGIEVFCRLALGLGDPPLYVADPQIEYMLAPNQDVQRFHNRVLVNQWGMRSRPFGRHKEAANELRVMVFGDSVVNGGSQVDHAQLATTVLEQRLSAQLKRPVTVGNVSAGSWGPGNWLAYARRFGVFDADTVLLVVNSGDYADNPTFEPLRPDTHPTAKPTLATQEAIARYLPRYLPWVKPTSSQDPSAQAVPSEQEAETGLRDLRDFLLTVRIGGARVVVLHHPDIAELKTGEYAPGQDRMRKLCQENNMPFVEMRGAYLAGGSTSLYRDGVHLNAGGQAVLAAQLLDALALALP